MDAQDPRMSPDEAWVDLYIHTRGALTFGTRWLAVNTIITDICRRHDIAVWEEPWRTVLPAIAWAWCQDVTTTEQVNKEAK